MLFIFYAFDSCKSRPKREVEVKFSFWRRETPAVLPPQEIQSQWTQIVDDPASRQLLFALLDDLPSWRARAMEQIQLSDAQWSERSRMVEVRALREVVRLQALLTPISEREGTARIIIPIGEFSKEPLHDFQVTVAGRPVHRMSRKDTARLQAAYMAHLAREAGIGDPTTELQSLLAHIFAFRPSVWRKMKKFPPDPCWRYFKERGIAGQINKNNYKSWKRQLIEPIQQLVQRHALSCPTSASENPLLALPSLISSSDPLSDAQINGLFVKLRDLLVAAEGKISDRLVKERYKKISRRLISLYCAYGRRWEAMAVCAVPLSEPFRIQVEEKREIVFMSPLRQEIPIVYAFVDPTTSFARHYVSFRDADSNYIHISSPDTHVHFRRRKCVVRDELWREINSQPDDERKEVEYYTRYDSTGDRSERMWVTCALRQNLLRAAMSWGVFLATCSAWFLMTWFGVWQYNSEARLNGADVVALLLPVTLAASLLLARESSTLGMRVKRVKQFLLMVALAILWGTTVWLYLRGHIVIDTLHQD